MIIGFIGFGNVSKRFTEIFNKKNISLITSIEKRSAKTINNIKNSNISVLDGFKEVAQCSDILISANSPKQALNVAKKYGKYTKGFYLDLNNISPKTTLEISKYFKKDNFIDGAIIGNVNRNKAILYVSGSKSQMLIDLNSNDLEVSYISNNIGDASTLKLLRSVYTKNLSGILLESFEIAGKLNLEKELYEILSLTEGEDFKSNSQSRIKNTIKNSNRKTEELEEIIDYFESDLTITKATLEKFKGYQY